MTDQTKLDATEIARDVIAHRLEIDYGDSDIAADVVTYRIVADLKRDGITFTADPPSGQVCVSVEDALLVTQPGLVGFASPDTVEAKARIRAALKGAES